MHYLRDTEWLVQKYAGNFDSNQAEWQMLHRTGPAAASFIPHPPPPPHPPKLDKASPGHLGRSAVASRLKQLQAIKDVLETSCPVKSHTQLPPPISLPAATGFQVRPGLQLHQTLSPCWALHATWILCCLSDTIQLLSPSWRAVLPPHPSAQSRPAGQASNCRCHEPLTLQLKTVQAAHPPCCNSHDPSHEMLAGT